MLASIRVFKFYVWGMNALQLFSVVRLRRQLSCAQWRFDQNFIAWDKPSTMNSASKQRRYKAVTQMTRCKDSEVGWQMHWVPFLVVSWIWYAFDFEFKVGDDHILHRSLILLSVFSAVHKYVSASNTIWPGGGGAALNLVSTFGAF